MTTVIREPRLLIAVALPRAARGSIAVYSRCCHGRRGCHGLRLRAFATLSSPELKQAGVGLAAAVLIDATLIRAVLLPATMKLLGDRNWYLPRRLQ